MRSLSNAKAIAGLLFLVFFVTVLAACAGPVQQVRVNAAPKKNEEAILNIAIDKQGKFFFTDKDGKPDPNTISFDEFVTQNVQMSEKGQAEQTSAAGRQTKSGDYYKSTGIKKIQTIEVYRRKGSVDIAFCIDNVCSCRRYNNSGQYCCACNCPCPN